jgi:AraC family transcriptional regulator
MDETITDADPNMMGSQNSVTAKDRAADMRYVVRASSRGRGWSGLVADLLDTPGGPRKHCAGPWYRVGMHMGAPVMTAWLSDGLTQRRLQVPGDIHIMPVGHFAAWEDDRPTQYFGVSLTPSLVRLAADEMRLNFDCLTLPPQMQLRDEKIEHILLAIKAELEEEDPHDRVYAEGLGLVLAAHLLRRYGRRQSNGVARGLTQRQLQSVRDYILEHLVKDLSVDEVASVAGISPSHFRVLFRQSIGLPVHKYVIKCRVERAVELLSNGSVKICEVALKSGFADQSHMSRCIRRVIGLTPAEVKRSVS